jgi:cytochrome oxidase Cu insertion factor (SCO1/SenC/PrrC family)
MSPTQDLEPAVRDPKKLKRTAWILVAIMVIGGALILKAYEMWSAKQSADDRPAVIHRIQKERDLRMLRQDGMIVNLFDLRGKVLVLNVLSLRDPEAAERSMAVMKRLSTQRAGDQDFHLVSLVIDPTPAENLRDTLAKAAETHGLKLPQWWLGGNEPGTLHKFIKNELKASVYPHEKDGRWNFDTSIVLIDKDGHLRRAVVPQKKGRAALSRDL